MEKEQFLVTILILIDGFLQLQYCLTMSFSFKSHNPYFNRWFSAIGIKKIFKEICTSHNPYFNRWFSAIKNLKHLNSQLLKRHNPYFNRWFSAI